MRFPSSGAARGFKLLDPTTTTWDLQLVCIPADVCIEGLFYLQQVPEAQLDLFWRHHLQYFIAVILKS